MRAGIEVLQRVELLAGADQLDRLAGDGAHRERRAAAAVAVDAREHDAGQADALVERAREVDRVLAGERIGDQQHLVRVRGLLHLGGFRHHLFVERDAARGVEHHHVVAAEACPPRSRGARSAAASGLRRSAASRPSTCRPSTASCSIAAGRRVSSEAISTLRLPCSVSRLRDLGGGGGFARALQADHHDGDRRAAH